MTFKKILFCLISFFVCVQVSLAAQSLERIVAIVDNDIILQSTLDEEYQRIDARIRASGQQPPEPEILRKQVLEHLVTQKIQWQAALKLGINIDDTQLNDHILRIAKENNLTVTELKQEIEQEGVSFADYRRTLREDIAIQQLKQRQVYNQILISEQEIDDFVLSTQASNQDEQYQLEHILIGLPEAASSEDVAAASQEAERVYQQLLDGSDFNRAAVTYSDGPKASQGGDLGWLKRAQIPTIFNRVIDTLQAGDISQPIRSPSGFHIVKLEAVRGKAKHLVDQVRVSHILIKVDALTEEKEAKEKVTKLRERILQGEDFVELAKAHSADGSAAQGGDLGWAASSEYVSSFQQAVETLPINVLSPPVRTSFGWHLIKVTGRRQYDETRLYQRNVARQQLYRTKALEEEQRWLQQLRDQAYVEYPVPVTSTE